MDRRAVVAIGGNALILDGQRGTIDEQYENARETATPHRDARRRRAGVSSSPTATDRRSGSSCCAPSSSRTTRRCRSSASRCPSPIRRAASVTSSARPCSTSSRPAGLPDRVVCVLTHVVVDSADPAFGRPTKPIGPFYSREEADDRAARRRLDDDRGLGPRVSARRRVPRTVADRRERPDPDARRRGLRRHRGRWRRCRGRGDGSRTLRAASRPSSTRTAPPRCSPPASTSRCSSCRPAWSGWPSTSASRTSAGSTGSTVPEARRYLAEGEFPKGSMGPKVEAAIRFIESGGQEVLITTPAALERAIAGETGTRIVSGHGRGPHAGRDQQEVTMISRPGRTLRLRVRSSARRRS